MKVFRKVLNRDNDTWLLCCWDECERPGYELFKVRTRTGIAEVVQYVFCSERHKQYWLNSHVRYGGLPEGMGSLL